jgi:hypothetical protein
MRASLFAVSALVAGAFVGGQALAQGTVDLAKTYTETATVTMTNNTNVSLSKDIDVKKTLQLLGVVEIDGTVDVSASGMSTVDSKQIINDNSVTSTATDPTDNSASLGIGVLQGATGNIGVNVSAGDNLVQQNAATLTTVGSGAGGADAEIFLYQESFNNTSTSDLGTATSGFTILHNDSTLSGNVLQGAAGNIGVNVATGVFNAQHNALALSTVVGTSALAEASVGSIQQATFNTTDHSLTDNTASVADAVLAAATGNIGLNVTAGSNNMQSNALSIAAQ